MRLARSIRCMDWGCTVRVVRDGLWLCSDCTLVACNGFHGIELADPEATINGVNALGRHLVPVFDSETGRGVLEFSAIPCASCKTHLAGYRAEFAILGK